MSDTVLILGAGASAEAGAPVMSNFLDVARRLERTPGTNRVNRAAFCRVFNAIAELQAVYAKSNIDTDNIEAVFAAFEMGKLFGRLGALSSDAVDALPNDMRTLIVQTLESEMALKVSGSIEARRFEAPEAYRHLIEILPSNEQHPNAVSIITFNYDLALDYTLHAAGIPIDYCLGPMPSLSGLPVMKLHGSINWVACSGCQVAPYTLREYFTKYRWDSMRAADTVTLEVSAHLDDPFPHCNMTRETVPLLVPPTWSKAEHHQRLANVWRQAAKHLSEARHIIVIGYSLPETDHFFRYLYALGTVSATRIEKFWVIDSVEIGTEASRQLDRRFRSMLGPIAEKRFRFLPGHRFGQSVGLIKAEFLDKERQ